MRRSFDFLEVLAYAWKQTMARASRPSEHLANRKKVPDGGFGPLACVPTAPLGSGGLERPFSLGFKPWGLQDDVNIYSGHFKGLVGAMGTEAAALSDLKPPMFARGASCMLRLLRGGRVSTVSVFSGRKNGPPDKNCRSGPAPLCQGSGHSWGALLGRGRRKWAGQEGLQLTGIRPKSKFTQGPSTP